MTESIEVRARGFHVSEGCFVREVFVSVGQTVAHGALLVDIEEAKANVEIHAPAAGRVIEVLAAANVSVREDDLLLVLELIDEQPAGSPKQPSGAGTKADASTVSNSNAGTNGEFHASPWIRGLARERGLDLSKIEGTGRRGRILEADLERPVHSSLASPLAQRAEAPAGNDRELPVELPVPGGADTRPLSRLQCAVGRNLTRNWTQIPHVTQFDETDITELEAFRLAINHERQKEGPKLSLLPFVVKATACALSAFPEFNSSLASEKLILKHDIHLGFAVDTEEGLVVPVLKHVERLTLMQIANEISRLAVRARAARLTSTDVQGGSFTISNLGSAGGTAFTPIINGPEVAILGVSKAELKPKWNGSAFVPRLMLPLSLSYDHRVINGVAGARFVSYLGSVLADLRRTLL
ncbi:MAG: 2-oxo acid dehydrogenase subunit E2 [Pseudomonadota bacterium]